MSALVQTTGRAARNEKGHVIMYADRITKSMAAAIEETERRREKQIAYNKKHNITPTTIVKDIKELIRISTEVEDENTRFEDLNKVTQKERKEIVETMELEMKVAAKELDFERATQLRDMVFEIKAAYNIK